ncbi:gephyrin-like molybdotransferase receptor GlpR [Nocardia sp. NPDC052254]|uniref:divisome protein SepX/GlpR n=1 Tax=Nocardia sp. NPDC052254 TaxID=3155681 RepID=UPI0034325E77
MPNSILWIALVVLWVFVLFPMLADRHPRIRRTTDAALATRVLYRGGTRRRAKKGPATGHETDPDWVPAPRQKRLSHGDDAEDRMTNTADEPVTEDEPNAPGDTDSAASRRAGDDATSRSRDGLDDDVDAATEYAAGDDTELRDDAADLETTDPDDMEPEAAEHDSGDAPDADLDGDRAGDGGGAGRSRATMARIPPAPTAAVPARLSDRDFDDDFDDDESDGRDFVPSRRGRGGFDPEADAIARVARYRFRQRAALGLIASALLFGVFALAVDPILWWAGGLSLVALGAYLGYLRRQVRFEKDIRRRRAGRLSGTRQRAEEADEPLDAQEGVRTERRPGMDRDAARALRRRAVVLDVDDEDPLFDHLEHFDAAAARATRNRASGGEIRRAAGE